VRAGLERFARRWWGGELGAAGRALAVVTAPASWAWWALDALRARGPTRSSQRRIAGLRVISVGNLAVGGTGKTPIVGWVTSVLRTDGTPTCVLVGPAASDEAELHRRWNPSVPVLVHRDRVAGAERARAAGARTAVLDDGFQHRELARDLDIVLISADDPFPGSLLPRGPYREPSSALGRADAVLVTRRAATAERALAVISVVESRWPGRLAGVVALAPGAWVRLDGSPASTPRGDVVAVCAIARPETFAQSICAAVGGKVELVAFADHHAYDRRDAERLRRRSGGRMIVLTEKDAVKLARWSDDLGEAVVLRDELRWEHGEAGLRGRLLAASAETEAA